jgi:hypothetical protein
LPDVSNLRTPVSILREQAAALTDETNGTLVGTVATESMAEGAIRFDRKNDAGQTEQGLIRATFGVYLDIRVPSLNDYRYRVLTYFQPLELYPGYIRAADDEREVTDEAQFIEALKSILSSSRVKSVLRSLMAQAADA